MFVKITTPNLTSRLSHTQHEKKKSAKLSCCIDQHFKHWNAIWNIQVIWESSHSFILSINICKVPSMNPSAVDAALWQRRVQSPRTCASCTVNHPFLESNKISSVALHSWFQVTNLGPRDLNSISSSTRHPSCDLGLVTVSLSLFPRCTRLYLKCR